MQVSWDMTGNRLGYSYRQLQIIPSYYSGIFFSLKKTNKTTTTNTWIKWHHPPDSKWGVGGGDLASKWTWIIYLWRQVIIGRLTYFHMSLIGLPCKNVVPLPKNVARLQPSLHVVYQRTLLCALGELKMILPLQLKHQES